MVFLSEDLDIYTRRLLLCGTLYALFLERIQPMQWCSAHLAGIGIPSAGSQAGRMAKNADFEVSCQVDILLWHARIANKS